jgi:hypothetical protein
VTKLKNQRRVVDFVVDSERHHNLNKVMIETLTRIIFILLSPGLAISLALEGE